MIVIQIRLATISVVSLLAALITTASAVLGLVLGNSYYSQAKHIQIPCCLTAAAGISVTICHILGVPWSYKLLLLGSNALLSIVYAASGLYYLVERIAPKSIEYYEASSHHMELAFIVLWLISLLISISVTSYAIGAIYIAGSDPSDLENTHSIGGKELIESANSEHSPVMLPKPQEMQSFPDLGSPIDIPTVPSNMLHLSPRLSWPSSVGSLRVSPSLTSLQSALDVRNDALTGQSQVPSNASPRKSFKLKRKIRPVTSTSTFAKDPPLSPNTNPPNSHSFSPKSTRSPLKLNLKSSSFSLKRESSRHNGTTSPQLTGPHNNGPLTSFPAIPNVHGGNAHPYQNPATNPEFDQLPLPIEMLSADSETRKRWLIFPNENGTESRSVSGSSQVTGHVFPASEFNRKINAAGFQKDEPRPLTLGRPRQAYP